MKKERIHSWWRATAQTVIVKSHLRGSARQEVLNVGSLFWRVEEHGRDPSPREGRERSAAGSQILGHDSKGHFFAEPIFTSQPLSILGGNVAYFKPHHPVLLAQDRRSEAVELLMTRLPALLQRSPIPIWSCRGKERGK